MEIEVCFPGNKRVQARCGGFIVETDQPPERGGDHSAPNPFDLFLCSLASCTGYQVLSFLQSRSLPTEEAGVTLRVQRNPESHLVEQVAIDIRPGEGFPEKYHSALVRAAEQCLVKNQLLHPPEFALAVVPGRRP